MDSIVSGLIGGIIEGYFSIFFKNFKKEDFVLTTGTSNTSSVLYNLEINTDVVQEILNLPTLEVSKMSINKLTISLQPVNIRKVPVVIHIDRLDCLLSEPWTSLQPIPTVLEDFLKKLPNSKKQSYGMSEKLIDGFSFVIDHLHIEVDTCGKYKIEEKGPWTPPPLYIDLIGINIRTTNNRWEIVDLSTARDYNKNKKFIHVFKTMNVDSFKVTILDNDKNEIPLISNLPLTIRIVIRKELNNQLNGLSLEVIMDHFHSTIRFENLTYIANLLKGLSACFGRRDKPKEQPVKIPHPGRIQGIHIRSFSTVILDTSGSGMELLAKEIRVGTFWDATCERFEKQFEFCLGDVNLREFFSRTGPSSHLIIESDTSKQFTNPFNVIPPVPRTFHPNYNSYTVEKPLIYAKAILGKNPAFHAKLIVNPILFTMKPETVTAIADLVSKATPHINAIQELHNIKPDNIKLDSVIIQEGKSPLEEMFVLEADVLHVSLAFPSSENSDYVKVCLNIGNTKVRSHPKLDDSILLSTGIGCLNSFPGAKDDLVFKRENIKTNANNLHNVKFKIDVDFEWTVQFAPKAKPQRALYMPKNILDINISLGHLQPIIPNQPKPKLEPILIEGGLKISKFNGCLTQLQYQAILARIDQLLLLLPILQKLGSAGTNIEKPKTPVVFIVKVESGNWELCNDFTQNNDNTGKVEPIAGLEFHGIQCCIEILDKKQVCKFFIQNIALNALPNPSTSSKLFNPNSFIQTGSPQALFSLRFKNINHPPGELLFETSENEKITALSTVRKYLGNRAFYDGERSKLDIRLSSLYSGINPNPACTILNFFLKTDINIKQMITTLKEAKKSVENVDISSIANDIASEFKVDSFVESVKQSLDIDIYIDITDTRIYLVQDIIPDDNTQIHGNICLSIKRIFFDRHVDGKYKHKTAFQIDSVDVTCNKEENQIITTQSVFTPVSCLFQVEREWLLKTKEWNMDVNGFFDKINLQVTPTHARVFIDVIQGVKINNIREVINSISEYVTRVKSHLPDIKEQITDTVREHIQGSTTISSKTEQIIEIDEAKLEINTILEDAEQLSGWTQKAKTQLTNAEEDYKKISINMKQLEERTGESNIIGNSVKKGYLQMVSGRRLVKRYVAISKTGMLYVFQDQSGGKPMIELKLDSSTQVGMIEKMNNGFQIQYGVQSVIFSANDDMDLAGWTNEVLKRQVSGISGYQTQTADAFSQSENALNKIELFTNRIIDTSKQLQEQTKLIAKIKALEELVKQKDKEIEQLKSN